MAHLTTYSRVLHQLPSRIRRASSFVRWLLFLIEHPSDRVLYGCHGNMINDVVVRQKRDTTFNCIYSIMCVALTNLTKVDVEEENS